MKSPYRQLRGIATQAVAILTSKEERRRLAATPLYRNAFYLMLDTVATSLPGFFFWIIVARFYSDTEVGYGSAIISASSLLAAISVIGLNFSFIRFLPRAENPQRLINASFTLCGLVSLAVGLIYIAGLSFWSPAMRFIQLNPVFALVFLGMAAISTLSVLIDAVFIARRKAGFVVFKSAVFSLLKMLLPLAFVGFFHTFGVVASWWIALLAAFIVSIFLFLPRIVDGYRPLPSFDFNHLKLMWRYSTGSYLAALLSQATVMILPIMVLNLLGTQSSAYFYIAWMISSLLNTIPGSVSQSLFAEGSHDPRTITGDVTKSIRFTFLLLLPAVIVLLLAAKWILLAFGQSYSESALKLLWLLSIASLPMAVIQVYISFLRIKDRLAELLWVRGLITLLVLVASYLAIPSNGIMGVGYVWLGLHALVSIVVILRLRCLIKNVTGKAKAENT